MPKGTAVKLQPHEAEFVNLDNPKTMLEWVLPNFVALTAGETLPIVYNNRTYKIDVLEVEPGTAISLIDTNLNLDLAPPLTGGMGFGMGGGEKEVKPPSSPEKKDGHGVGGGTGVGGGGAGAVSGVVDAAGELKEGVDYKICDNCMHKISMNTYATHSAVCPRINWRCDRCGAVVQKAQREEHMREAHSPVTCEACGEVTESGKLAGHKESECKYRDSQCEFCELKMPYANKFEHEDKCGGITEPCPECKQRVRRRGKFTQHAQQPPTQLTTTHSYLDAVAHPSVCGTRSREHSFGYGDRHLGVPPSFGSGMRKSPSVFYCEKCSEVSISFDDLQVHMLTAHHDGETPQGQSAAEGGEKEGGGTTTTTTSTTTTTNGTDPVPMDTVILRKCAWSGCNKLEEEAKTFNICAGCRAIQRLVPSFKPLVCCVCTGLILFFFPSS